MKRRFALLLMLALLLCAPARAEYWAGAGDRSVFCREGRIGCQVLQTVMMGSFDTLDMDDRLSVRVFSAALGQLRGVTQADMAHFLEEFSVGEEILLENYYIALGNCLLAEILLDPGETEHDMQVRRLLRLFLAPQTEVAGKEQIALLQDKFDDALIKDMAQTVDLPGAFIEYVVTSGHWTDEDES